MTRIKLYNWFINENVLSISLMHFVVDIFVLKNSHFVYYKTTIKDENMKELTLIFYSLEDAISFVEKIVKNSQNMSEVIEKYENMFEMGLFKEIPKNKTLNKR